MHPKTSNTRATTRIGVLVPFTNTNLEPDLQMMCPPSHSLHFTRIGGYDAAKIPGSDEMAQMGASKIDDALHLISGCHPDVVLYGCTSATLTHGRAFDLELADKIRAITKAPTITAAGAIITALKAANAKTISLVTPYVGEINTRTIQFLAEEGFKTVACSEHEKALSSHQQGALTPDQIIDMALKADTPKADALVLACTDMRAVEALSHLKKAVAKPVISSNQAMMFALSMLLDS